MELQFLGTGAGQPSKSRNVSSLVLKLLDEINEVWMFDCGEGTQRQILETTIKPRKVKKIFITHMHGDHIFGLPGFLASRSFQSSEEQTDLEVYGPVGIKQYVMTSIRTSGTRLSYHVHFKEIDENSLGLVMEDDKFAVYADKLDHTTFFVLVTVWFKRISKAPWMLRPLRQQAYHLVRFLDKSRMDKMWFLKMERKSLPKTLFPHLRKVRLSLS